MTDRDGVELRPGDHVDADGVEKIVTAIGERRISVIRAGAVEIVDGASVRLLSRRAAR